MPVASAQAGLNLHTLGNDIVIFALGLVTPAAKKTEREDKTWTRALRYRLHQEVAIPLSKRSKSQLASAAMTMTCPPMSKPPPIEGEHDKEKEKARKNKKGKAEAVEDGGDDDDDDDATMMMTTTTMPKSSTATPASPC